MERTGNRRFQNSSAGCKRSQIKFIANHFLELRWAGRAEGFFLIAELVIAECVTFVENWENWKEMTGRGRPSSQSGCVAIFQFRPQRGMRASALRIKHLLLGILGNRRSKFNKFQ